MLNPDTRCAKQALDRLDLEIQKYKTDGALSYFTGQLNQTQRIYITDYLCDVMQTLHSSLEDMDACLNQYKQKRFNEERNRRLRIDMSSPQAYVSKAEKAEEDARFYRKMMEEQFFLKFGGVIDLLASMVVMVSGIGLNVRTCGYRDLKPNEKVETQASKPANKLGLSNDEKVRNSQMSVLRSLQAAISADGDSDWFSWVLDRRNQMVHRAQGVSLVFLQQGNVRGQVNFVDLPPKYPQEGMISTYTNPEGIGESFIFEDIETVMPECHARLCHILIAVVDACESMCAQRGAGTINIDQQAEQWPLDKKSEYNFSGFNPDRSIAKSVQKKGNTLVGSGQLLERLKGAAAIPKKD